MYTKQESGESRVDKGERPPLVHGSSDIMPQTQSINRSGARALHRALTFEVSQLGSREMIDRAPSLPEHQLNDRDAKRFDAVINGAVNVVQRFLNPKVLKDQAVMKELLRDAQGLVFLTVVKAGFLLSGKIGKGFIIARTADGWSAPSFVGTAGVGFGMMAGGEMVDYMIILTSRSAVRVFCRSGQVQLGSELDVAVGPVGRAAQASLNVGAGGLAPNYSYSHSKGLYGGIGLAGACLVTRGAVNRRYYGSYCSVRHILSGSVTCARARPLSDAIEDAIGNRNRMSGLIRGASGMRKSNGQSLPVYTVGSNSGNVRSGNFVFAESAMRTSGAQNIQSSGRNQEYHEIHV